MTLLNRLERILSPFAITGLIRYVVAFNALIFVLSHLSPGYTSVLDLDGNAILHGQVWRLLTWIFIPTTNSFLWILFYLMFLWWVGDTLEATWGTFRLNAYYFLGMAGSTAGALLVGWSPGNLMLNFSLLLAVATIAPDLEILFLFFPVKIKWIALLSIIFPWGLMFVTGSLATQIVILICLSNYFLFFGPTLIRGAIDRQSALKRRAKFEAAKDHSASLHCCSVCGITEVSDPHADFRVSSDDKEYCTKHLPARATQ